MDNLVVIILSFLTFCTQHYPGKGLKQLEVTSVEIEDLLEDIERHGSVVIVKPDPLPSQINLNYINESSSQESDSDLSSDFSDLIDDDDDDEDEEDDDEDNYNNPTRGFNLKKEVLRWSDSCNKKAAKVCKKACVQGLKDACYEYHCRKSMKKSFKKECKRECKAVFSSNHRL